MLEEAEAPTPAQEAFQRALEHEKNNELGKAIEDCTEALQLDPANLEYLTTRAESYGEMRNQDKAMVLQRTVAQIVRSTGEPSSQRAA